MNKYSQHGEEEVINELCNLLKINSGWLVDVGAWDGKCFSNIFHLIEKGNFKAIDIEGNQDRFKKLIKTAEEYPNIIPILAYLDLKENKLDNLLSKTEIPKEFEILNIDIDSIDYQVWDSLKDYSPKIVVVEFQPRHGKNEEYIHKGHEDFKTQGSSYLSFCKLAESKGYKLYKELACNLFFVRSDLI